MYPPPLGALEWGIHWGRKTSCQTQGTGSHSGAARCLGAPGPALTADRAVACSHEHSSNGSSQTWWRACRWEMEALRWAPVGSLERQLLFSVCPLLPWIFWNPSLWTLSLLSLSLERSSSSKGAKLDLEFKSHIYRRVYMCLPKRDQKKMSFSSCIVVFKNTNLSSPHVISSSSRLEM